MSEEEKQSQAIETAANSESVDSLQVASTANADPTNGGASQAGHAQGLPQSEPAQPAPQTAAQSASQPASQPTPQPAPQPAPQPTPQEAPQPVGVPPTAQGMPVSPAYQPQVQPGYAPQAAPQPVFVPTPLQQLTGGMKFAWAVIGAFLGIPGVVLAWVCNADKVPQVKNDAVKFSIIGFVVWIGLGVVVGLAIGGIATATFFGALGAYL